MKLTRLRLVVACIWLTFGFSATLLVILSESLRKDIIHLKQVLPAIVQLTGIWLPPLTCFCSFWFKDANADARTRSIVDRERAILAIGLTSAYILILLVLLFVPLFIDQYPQDPITLEPQGPSFSTQITDITKYALLLSPLVLAPVAYLTRRDRVHTRQIREG
jgi:hypothetical protein